MSICNCKNNTVIGREQCPADRVITPQDVAPMGPTTIEFEIETPTNFISGLDGKSAYEYAQEGGYEGTEEEFYADLGKIKEYEGRVDGFDERLTYIEEHGLVGKYLSEVDTFEGLSADDGVRVMYIGPTTEDYTSGYVYAYSSAEGAWSRVDVQPMPEVPEIPDLEEIRTAVSTFNSFYSDKDYVDSTINKWEELRDFLDGMSDQDTLSGKLTNMRESLEQQISDKQDGIIGAATTITDVNLSANKALVSNAQGKVAVSTVSAAELGYLSGTTGAIQTQIDGKQDELTFDNAPTANSTNPVTSDGIKRAIDNAIQQAEENPRALKQVADLGSYNGQLGDIVQYTGPTTAKYVNGYVYKNATERKTIATNTRYINITDDSLVSVGVPQGVYYKLPNGTTDEVTANLRWWFWIYKDGNVDVQVPFSRQWEEGGFTYQAPTEGATVWHKGEFLHIASMSGGVAMPSTITLDDGTVLTVTNDGDGRFTPESSSLYHIYLSATGHKLYQREYYDQSILVNEKGNDGVYQIITTKILALPNPSSQYMSGYTSEETVIELGGWQQWNVQPETDISGKQDTLTFDSTPTLGSSNPVSSNGIRLAIDAASALNRLRFATAASVSYNLATVDTSTYAVNDMLTITDLGSNSLRYTASGVQRTFTGPFDFDLMFRYTGSEFRPMFPFMNWSEYN